MKTLKRWLANIKWLFNNPPVSFKINYNMPECDYCPNGAWIDIEGKLSICTSCLKKALDKALKEEK